MLGHSMAHSPEAQPAAQIVSRPSRGTAENTRLHTIGGCSPDQALQSCCLRSAWHSSDGRTLSRESPTSQDLVEQQGSGKLYRFPEPSPCSFSVAVTSPT